MNVSPDYERFRATYEAGTPQVAWTTLVADLETPISAYLKLSAGSGNSFLLESVEGGAIRGRYSIIGIRPDLIWRCYGDQAEINREVTTRGTEDAAFSAEPGGALASLRRLLTESLIELPEGLPPMAAGIVGFMGYDTVRLMENLGPAKPDDIGVPDGLFIRPTVMAIFDSIRDTITLVTPVRPDGNRDAAIAYDEARTRLGEALAALDRPLTHAPGDSADVPALDEPRSNTEKTAFFDMVAKAKEYILAGDIFQVVLSQRFSLPFTLPPVALYRALRRTNPSPFMYFLDFDDLAVVGSSPEILVRVRDGKVTIRPIAGTRPRGATPAEDRELKTDLLSDPKELSEHLMLLDLGRNDVGRVARPGTVQVTEKNTIEYYSHVMHIVSNVEGELDPAHDALDALAAGFPAGTVSGAPKIRAMEIIDELESAKRGIYAGSVGYFSANGSMDTCIVLRTAIVKDGMMHVQAGAGIVADSVPENEYEETRAKARALIRAAEEAVRFASEGGAGR
ncbi:MAG: anthranilate synthase component I [Alphaproteobacteria bacterium]|nr:MAG: anthranilate synthase component I [Alphaproteobacteria bacterium]